MSEQELNDKMSKLPIWAQKHIHVLTKQAEESDQKLKEFVNDQTKTNIYYQEYFNRDNKPEYLKKYIPNSPIIFQLSGESYSHTITMTLCDSDKGKYINIVSQTGSVIIKPICSNSVDIKIEDR